MRVREDDRTAGWDPLVFKVTSIDEEAGLRWEMHVKHNTEVVSDMREAAVLLYTIYRLLYAAGLHLLTLAWPLFTDICL
jgi:hypothetical protein